MLHYFNQKLSPGFVALYSGRMLQYAGFGVIGLFLPVYLFIHFGYRDHLVFVWFLAGYLLYMLFLPWAGGFLNRFGMRRAIRASVVLDAFYLVSVYLVAVDPRFAYAAVFFVVLARLGFWLPFHVDFAKFTDRGDRGKEVSLLWATRSFLGIIMPIASGLIISFFSFRVAFLLAVVLYLAAVIPFMSLPRTEEKYSWGYFQTWRNFFRRANRPLVVSNIAYGAENSVALVMWPIFIWRILNGDYVEVGLISSVIVLIGVAVQLFAGNLTDRLDKRRLLHWGSIFYSLGWFAKAFVLTGFHVFIAGTYHQFSQIFKDTPFDALNYELLADRGHFVDEYTVLKEMAIQLGRVMMFAFAAVIALQLGMNWTFALAAIASLFVNFL